MNVTNVMEDIRELLTTGEQKFEYRGLTVDITLDFHPCNPREWCDPLFYELIERQNRYSFKDGDLDVRDIDEYLCSKSYLYNLAWEQDFEEYMSDGDKLQFMENTAEDLGCFIHKLFVYDHSGVSLSLGRTCSWDSSFCGYVFIDAETMKSDYSGDYDKAIKSVNAYINEYNCYLSGDVYFCRVYRAGEGLEQSHGFTLSRDEEEIDCCSGFYGYQHDENGLGGFVCKSMNSYFLKGGIK